METVNKTDRQKAMEWWVDLPDEERNKKSFKYKTKEEFQSTIETIWRQATNREIQPTNNNTDLKCTPEGFQELYMALEGIIKNWTKDNEIEEFISGEIHGETYSYWAPAARMVSSEFIAKGREILKKANPNYKP